MTNQLICECCDLPTDLGRSNLTPLGTLLCDECGSEGFNMGENELRIRIKEESELADRLAEVLNAVVHGTTPESYLRHLSLGQMVRHMLAVHAAYREVGVQQ